MHKARSVFVYLHPRFQQNRIKAPADAIDYLLIRDARHDYPDIDTPCSRPCNGIKEPVSENKIRRIEPSPALSLGEKFDEKLIACGLASQGRIIIAENVAIFFLLII